MGSKVLFLSAIFVIVGVCWAQEKEGDCPPLLLFNICQNTCYSDSQCNGKLKCCPTTCGGTVCTRAVAVRKPEIKQEKAGFCPQYKTGPWVCTSRCALDSDCRGRLKCCENRCGAMACAKPEF